MVAEIESLESFRKLIAGDSPVVVDFWASWCGPCKMIGPVFEKLSAKTEFSNVKFYKCDTEAQADVMQECGIQVLPTFLLFHKGDKIGESKGAAPANLQKLIEQGAALISSSATSESKADDSTHTSTHEAGAPGAVMAESAPAPDSGAGADSGAAF